MNIGIIGYGKMGRAVEKCAIQKGHNIVFKINSLNKHDLNKNNLSLIDVAIEFSSPQCAFDNIVFCLTNKVPIVSGTTGWQKRLPTIKDICLTHKASFLHAPNFSLGVNIFFDINNYVAKLMQLKKYNIELEEKHHKMKKDMPSGTAIKILNDISLFRNKNNENPIPIKSKRMGQVKGEHIVKYISEIDEITISHKSKNRNGFSEGALLAAEFIRDKQGYFKMTDVIKNL
tara:strand:- start:71200 stop:71889 length:690 start_codon:yes stop_codon:yes gene_type:complete